MSHRIAPTLLLLACAATATAATADNSFGTGFAVGNATTPASSNGNVAVGTTTQNRNLIVNGNVGIGTASPAARLTVSGASANEMRIQILNSSGAGTYPYLSLDHNGPNGSGIADWANASVVEGNGSGGLVLDSYLAPLRLQAGRVTRMMIDNATGSVGIGTTPAYRFHAKHNDAELYFARPNQNAELWLTSTSNVYADMHFATFKSATTPDQVILRGSSYGLNVTGPNPRLAINAADANRPGISLYVNGATQLEGNTTVGASTPVVNGGRFFDVQNADGNAGSFSVMRLITQQAGATAFVSADIAKYKSGGLLLNNHEVSAAAYTGFGVGGTERMRIASNGNVGIGTLTPAAKLDVVGGMTAKAATNGIGIAAYSNEGEWPAIAFCRTGFNSKGYLLGSANDGNFNAIVKTGDTAVVAFGNAINANVLALTTHANGSTGVRITNDAVAVGTSTSESLATYSPSDNKVALQTLLDGRALAGYGTYGGDENRLLLQPLVGNVGIGTSAPTAKLDVAGTMNVTNANGSRVWTGRADSEFDIICTYDGAKRGLSIHGGSGAAPLEVYGRNATAYIPALLVQADGSVRIGAQAKAGAKLSVDGAIAAREIKVTSNGWADHVFADGYKLPTLAEVERHIAEKKHLPGIPSEAEVMANGIDTGDMLRRQMAKIEELTLYVIQIERARVSAAATQAELLDTIARQAALISEQQAVVMRQHAAMEALIQSMTKTENR